MMTVEKNTVLKLVDSNGLYPGEKDTTCIRVNKEDAEGVKRMLTENDIPHFEGTPLQIMSDDIAFSIMESNIKHNLEDGKIDVLQAKVARSAAADVKTILSPAVGASIVNALINNKDTITDAVYDLAKETLTVGEVSRICMKENCIADCPETSEDVSKLVREVSKADTELAPKRIL